MIFVLTWLILTNAKYPGDWQLLAWGLQQATYVAIVAGGVWQVAGKKRPPAPLLLCTLAIIIRPPQTLQQLFAYLWLFALASAFVIGGRWQVAGGRVQKAALVVFIPYALLSPFVATNTNIVAMELWALFFVALPDKPLFTIHYSLFTILALFAIWYTGSEGGLLALGAGLLWYFFKWRGLLAIPLALLALVWLKLGNMGSLGVRLELYEHAWHGFTLTPIMGQGWGSFEYQAAGLTFYQAHNLPLDILYSWGLIGLALIAFITIHYSLFTIHYSLYAPFFIAFLTHSLVDNPHWTALPGLLVAFLLGQAYARKSLHPLPSALPPATCPNPNLDGSRTRHHLR